jgi:4-hydroxybenzoyl-CoA thioesterase
MQADMTNNDSPPNMFRKTRHVHFSHCDPAGIVFFPRYLVQLNDFIEEWFNEGLGLDYASLITVRKMGIPTVRLECDFVSPAPFGSKIEWRLSVERIGTSSITLVVEGWAEEVRRFRLRSVIVMTEGHQGRSAPLPNDVRSALDAFCGSALTP